MARIFRLPPYLGPPAVGVGAGDGAGAGAGAGDGEGAGAGVGDGAGEGAGVVVGVEEGAGAAQAKANIEATTKRTRRRQTIFTEKSFSTRIPPFQTCVKAAKQKEKTHRIT